MFSHVAGITGLGPCLDRPSFFLEVRLDDPKFLERPAHFGNEQEFLERPALLGIELQFRLLSALSLFERFF